MICWSCQKSAGDGLLCAGCGAIQPPDPKADHFSVMGVGARFDLDPADLERRYKEAARVLHPDRFARADARARRASLQRSVQLNEAWRTLKDPVRRAEYLLAREGLEIAGQAPASPALLMDVLALREALAEARAAGDHDRVEALAADVRGRNHRAMTAVAEGFAAGAGALEEVARQLVAVRYYQRFLEEVAAHEEARAEAGGNHGG